MKKNGTALKIYSAYERAPELKEIQNLMPMDPADYDNLKKDIEINGIRDPLKVYHKKGKYYVIAGHNRLKIAREIGYKEPIPADVYEGKPEEFRELAINDNLNRRHLTRDQKNKLIDFFLKTDPEQSNRQIAKKAGVSPTTVQTQREKTGVQIGHVTGADGKTYKKPQKPEQTPKESIKGTYPGLQVGKAHHKVLTAFYKSLPEHLAPYQTAAILQGILKEMEPHAKRTKSDYLLKAIQKAIRESREVLKALEPYKKDYE